ncbi:hypothetical protein AGMMS49545_22660 [Betaproteobacteria bacterium]|nr:hypothetical protein AGMMS49545_22660 [Betaproteobacteria bacterium]GHU48565.1 hypothetical protein AGMMS50289_25320 [Betaproteobacteria bacterium]
MQKPTRPAPSIESRLLVWLPLAIAGVAGAIVLLLIAPYFWNVLALSVAGCFFWLLMNSRTFRFCVCWGIFWAWLGWKL